MSGSVALAWADGFGIWHVRVPRTHPATARASARRALREVLEGPSCAPSVWQRPRRVFSMDTETTVVYREGDPM